ncbi:MAG: GNAT family N-acetyltransferase [Bacteroidales bacterium]|nr:GNAT family N-acetyltransferase [Bacteroidales bacterium]
MKEIIAPIDPEIIKQELTEDKLVRQTNAGNNSIYLIDAHNSPNTMREIGRLREYTFREAGGGTGEEIDIDEYDTAEVPFKQLIVWSNENQEIVSAYRYILGKDVPLDENGYPHTPTSKLFFFSEKFIQNEWQQTIELGRSFVQPKYQATNSLRLGLFSLDNIWDGLGSLIVDYPEIKYFFGKMTMYNSYNRMARNMILGYLQKHFQGDEELVHPFEPALIKRNKRRIMDLFNHSLSEDFKILNKNVRDLKTSIPPLIKSYMSLSPSMRYFGASANPEFGPVEEIAILINVNDIYEDKKKRHIDTYKK